MKRLPHIFALALLIAGVGFAVRADSRLSAIVTGSYRDAGVTKLSLAEISAKKSESRLVPFTECAFAVGPEVSARHAPVVINEIAWMGAPSGATHEWIELKNISGEPVRMAGWQLVNENERLRVVFPQQFVFEKDLLVSARSAANDALGLNAAPLFTGALRNAGEGLRLFDHTCALIDEVPTALHWPAGDAKSKRTMERLDDFSWATSPSAGGTPGKENAARPPKPRSAPASLPAERTKPDQNSAAHRTAPCAAGQININSADKAALTTIRHIGTARAEAIIAARPFTRVEDLKGRVSGIGEKRLADIIAQGKACAEESPQPR